MMAHGSRSKILRPDTLGNADGRPRATTEDDIRRHAIEDGEDPDATPNAETCAAMAEADEIAKAPRMTPASRAKRCYTNDALVLLSQTIKLRRIERRMTMQEVADLAGVSRGLVRKIEAGDPRCSIGAVFMVAATVGVALFDLEPMGVSMMWESQKKALTLLPKAVTRPRRKVFDDF